MGRDAQDGKSTDQQEYARYTSFSAFLLIDTEAGQSTDQQGNDTRTGSNWSFNSWAEMLRMGNQQINRNMRAMTYFFSACFNFLSTYQRGILLALGKFELQSWAVMRKMVNQHINRILRIILYFSAFRSVTLILGNQHINKEMTHLLGEI